MDERKAYIKGVSCDKLLSVNKSTRVTERAEEAKKSLSELLNIHEIYCLWTECFSESVYGLSRASSVIKTT